MTKIKLWFQPGTRNSKTGNIPTACVGQSIKQTKQSCTGCALFRPNKKIKDTREFKCYAWSGTVKLSTGAAYLSATNGKSHTTMVGTKATKNGGRYTLEYALKNRSHRSKYFRVSSIGDPARADRKELNSTIKRIRKEPLDIIGYTHFWKDWNNRGLKNSLMASCDNIDQADEAINKGFIPAAIIPEDTPKNKNNIYYTSKGTALLACMNQTQKIKGVEEPIQCNECGLCSVNHKIWSVEKQKIKGIGFFNH